MCPQRRVEIGKEDLEAQRKGHSDFFLTYRSLVSPSAIRNKTGGREFVVDSGASMHMVCRKRPELCRLGNRVQTREEATVYVKELDLFVTVKLLQDTLGILSLGKLCVDRGYSYEWISGQKPQLNKDGRRIKCRSENNVPIVVPGLSTGSSSSATPTGFCSLRHCVQKQHEVVTRTDRNQKINKNKDTEPVGGDLLRDLPERLEEFTEIIMWTKEFQHTGTRPRVLLVSQLQSR